MNSTPHSSVPPTPRVAAETARDHVANAAMALGAYRDANGGDWIKALNGPVQINELASLLESVEARLRLALDK